MVCEKNHKAFNAVLVGALGSVLVAGAGVVGTKLTASRSRL